MVNEKEFWKEVRKGIPKYSKRKPRVVPAFTIQALQDNTVVADPPRCAIYEQHPPKPSRFREYFDRGLIPMTFETDGTNSKINWKANIHELDYSYYLPLLFDGLTETERPYKFLVEQGVAEMVEAGATKVIAVIPMLIVPIKKAFNTKVPQILCTTLRVLQVFVQSGNCVGEALVPYFRQILPVINLLIHKNLNLGEEIDYTQQKGENVADLMQETLEVLERYGGEDAFINIKYMVPTYESCMRN